MGNTKEKKSKTKSIDDNKQEIDSILQKVVLGDLSALTTEERQKYYIFMAKKFGLDPETKPFDYLLLDGRLVLYATRNCTDQLRLKNSITTKSIQINFHDNIVYAIVCIQDKNGREEYGVGSEMLEANDRLTKSDKIMMAETKAKRRATISMLALGMLDETEITSIKNAQRIAMDDSKVVNDNIDMLERQKNIERLKELPSDLRQRMSKYYKLNGAIDMCIQYKWDANQIEKHIHELELRDEKGKNN